MSTDDLDGRLHAAGQRWRSANTTLADVDLGYLEIPADPVDVAVTPIHGVNGAPKRRRRIRVVLAAGAGVAAAIAAAVIAVSLGGSSPAHRHEAGGIGASALVGVDWRLATIAGTGAPLAITAPLMIDSLGQLTGTDGCNHLGAHVTIASDTINLGAVVATEVACVDRKPAFAAQVARVDAVLNGTLQWSVQGDELTLSRNGAAVLVYRAAPPPITDPKILTGSQWQLSGVAQDGPNGAASSVSTGAPLKFDAHGGFTASDGCNSGGGQVAITAGKLVISGYVSTKMACTGVDPAQTKIVNKVLDGSVSWSIKDGQLTLRKAGVGSLSYRQAPTSPTPAPTGSS